MKSSGHTLTADSRHTSVILKQDLQVLFSDASIQQKQALLQRLAPTFGPVLEQAFMRFLANEEQQQPMNETALIALFSKSIDPHTQVDALVETLYALAPGNGRIGFKQVNMLADHLRQHVDQFLRQGNHQLQDLLPHDHVFGSGGDFCKTIHASTAAAIIAAPVLRICKTGTTNVTSYHGSAQVMKEFGYTTHNLSIKQINNELLDYGFAFVPLSALDFPYSDALKAARGQLWYQAKSLLEEKCAIGASGWQDAVRNTRIPLDIFKIVSPNAQVLHPLHHSTGVCHIDMMPYVLSLYLHLNSTGIIVHNYDTIDELANASSNPIPDTPNNLIIQVEADAIRIAECSPEDLGFARAKLSDIQEVEDLVATNEDFWRIISGVETGPKRDFLVANAALLLVAGHKIPTSQDEELIEQIKSAISVVEELIDSHKAEENFQQLLGVHNYIT